ncbi:acyltransferase family protein [Myceligenerans pegani]|uniref:Acyltransferase n=1 Tax=Myceligenerans pegani TaxID=2776917 RepID=A0ABR9MTS7_9MICO|nr:acyltransferase family protein [Myceligenerans sp. TRM 65318]MBE1874774.1 acyltransferase [Myceligenerans sp. TRM 65318]MBE3017045.1 acyltransferase [Myceligenerans sp. TRM 65318]
MADVTTDPRTAGPQPAAAGAPSEPLAGPRIRGLDGLRALAVAAVVGYHLEPGWVPGGFVGVDMFFVVSGFLITTLLLREIGATSWIDVPRFWTRRARRLLPALFLLLLVSVPVARLVEPDLTVGIGRQVLGATTFGTNWLEISAGSDYFDETAPELLRPLWSLAIEEQFYLVWPVLLVVLLLTVPSGRWRVRVALGAAVASATAMALLYPAGDDPTRVYYGTDTHAFGLLLGAAVTLRWARARPLLHGLRAHLLPVLALGGLVALWALLRSDSALTYPGGLLLASLLTLVLVLGCVSGVRWLTWLLELAPLRWVGERSYGIYLWHWPVLLVVGAVMSDGGPGAAAGSWARWAGDGVVVAVMLAVSALSYRFVEMPVRRRGFRGAFRALWAQVTARVPDARPWAARVAVGAVVLALAGTTTAVATAPRLSGAEQAVAAGLAAQEAAERAAGGTKDSGDPGGGSAGDRDTTGAERSGDGSGTGPGAGSRGGAGDDAGPLPPGGGQGERISGFGDSVLAAAVPAVLGQWPRADIDAEPIRQWRDAPRLVRRAAERGALRDVVVLNFGTNAGFQGEGSVEAAERTLDLIGPERLVVLVNTVGISYWVPDANARLEEIAAGRDNVVVMDWNAVCAKRPELLHADATHPNMEGIAVYATELQKSFDELEKRSA